jgi:hypothetical protein
MASKRGFKMSKQQEANKKLLDRKLSEGYRVKPFLLCPEAVEALDKLVSSGKYVSRTAAVNSLVIKAGKK